MKKETFLDIIKNITPKQLNKLIEENGKVKLVPLFIHLDQENNK